MLCLIWIICLSCLLSPISLCDINTAECEYGYIYLFIKFKAMFLHYLTVLFLLLFSYYCSFCFTWRDTENYNCAKHNQKAPLHHEATTTFKTSLYESNCSFTGQTQWFNRAYSLQRVWQAKRNWTGNFESPKQFLSKSK